MQSLQSSALHFLEAAIGFNFSTSLTSSRAFASLALIASELKCFRFLIKWLVKESDLMLMLQSLTASLACYRMRATCAAFLMDFAFYFAHSAALSEPSFE